MAVRITSGGPLSPNVHFSMGGAQNLFFGLLRRMVFLTREILSIFWMHNEKHGFAQCSVKTLYGFYCKNLNILPVALKIAIFMCWSLYGCFLPKVYYSLGAVHFLYEKLDFSLGKIRFRDQ